MSTIQELEQKIRRLEQQIIRQEEATKALLAKSDKALDVAMNAYRIDHHGYVWVRDKEKQQYRKTDVCVRVIIPKVKPKEITNCKIDDKAVNNRTLDDGCVDNRVLAERSVGTDNLLELAIITKLLANLAVTNEKLANDAVQTRNIKDRNVTSKKIDLNAIKPEHVSPSTFRELAKDLQNQIDSLEIAGVAVSNEFGTDPHISISQKTITDAINKLWQKLEDMTGEVLQGISMSVTPDYFISEDGCSVHISANTVETNGIFEHIAFYGNGSLIAEADNVDFFEYDMEITETTIIKCVAKIMGVEYTRQQIVTHYSSFWLGAGSTYSDIMDVEHVIPITNGMRGAYDVDAAQGDHIIIVVGESLAGGFLRADMNSVEINFTESTVTVDGKNYKVFTSEEAYSEGTYNIDING